MSKAAGNRIGANGGGIAIETRGLTKRYAEVTAVDSLDLSVREGEIYGFLGRNGAGKTTTIRMLVGLVRPTRGGVRIFGRDVVSDRGAAVATVGGLVETATSYPNLTVRENLEIQRALTNSPRESVKRVIKLLGLQELTHRRAGRLSLGNRQRLALARAILHRPRLLILDEPANALDPAGIVEIRQLLRRLADDEGATIFVSSHILSEVSQLVDRIGIIHRGRLVEEIATETRDTRMTIGAEVSDAARAARLIREALGAPEVRVVDDGKVEIDCRELRPAAVARLIVEAGIDLEAMYPMREDLEARFLRLTGGEE